MSDTRVSTVQVQPGECFPPIPKNMSVIQPCEFHVILLILLFSLEIDNLTTTRTRLRFRDILCPKYACLPLNLIPTFL